MKEIEIPFGAKDSELKGWEYTIPEGMEAEIKDGKIVVREKESEDERIRKWILEKVQEYADSGFPRPDEIQMANKAITYLEKQKGCIADSSNTSASEDEKTMEEIINWINGRTTYEWSYEWCENKDRWTAYLEKQKEQKPAEWSEEDETFAYFVNQFLEYHEKSDPTAKSCKKWFNNRLKSIRPVSKESLQSWKPSEEQIYSLGTVVKGYDECTVGSVGYRLKEMYEQLKKLM